MDNAVVIAVLVSVTALATGVASPLLLSWQTNKHRRDERREDYQRQDAVAAQAAEAARLLLAANERVAASTVVTNDKLDVIHALVNSNMTAAMQAELDATVRELAMMREVVELKHAAGRDPTAEALAAIAATASRIDELQASLADRLEQTKVAESRSSR